MRKRRGEKKKGKENSFIESIESHLKEGRGDERKRKRRVCIYESKGIAIDHIVGCAVDSVCVCVRVCGVVCVRVSLVATKTRKK